MFAVTAVSLRSEIRLLKQSVFIRVHPWFFLVAAAKGPRWVHPWFFLIAATKGPRWGQFERSGTYTTLTKPADFAAWMAAAG